MPDSSSSAEKENALRKLERKSLDAIVLNSLRDAGAGFGTDTNRVTILKADGQSAELPLLSKADTAAAILDFFIGSSACASSPSGIYS